MAAHDPHPSAPTPSAGTALTLLDRLRGREPEAWERLARLYGPLVLYWGRRAGRGRRRPAPGRVPVGGRRKFGDSVKAKSDRAMKNETRLSSPATTFSASSQRFTNAAPARRPSGSARGRATARRASCGSRRASLLHLKSIICTINLYKTILNVLNWGDLSELTGFLTSDPVSRGGVRVSVADVTGDGRPEVIATAGSAARAFDPVTGAAVLDPLADDEGFLGGVAAE
jgi:hypothetical protein